MGFTKAAQVKSLSVSPCGTNVNEGAGDAFVKPILSLSRRKQCFWCSYTHTLVLSYYTWFTVKGPLLPLHGAVIFEQREACPSAGTLSPQSQSIKVAARCSQLSHWAREWVPFEVLLHFIVAKWFCFKVHCTVQKSTVVQCTTHSWRKQIVLRAKGRPCKSDSGSLRQMQAHWINESLTLRVCLKMTNAWVREREKPKRETIW